MWAEYTQLRAKKLPQLWQKFFTDIQLSHVMTEPLFMKIVNEILFEKLIEAMFTFEPKECAEVTELTKDEENICMWICRDEAPSTVYKGAR